MTWNEQNAYLYLGFAVDHLRKNQKSTALKRLDFALYWLRR